MAPIIVTHHLGEPTLSFGKLGAIFSICVFFLFARDAATTGAAVYPLVRVPVSNGFVKCAAHLGREKSTQRKITQRIFCPSRNPYRNALGWGSKPWEKILCVPLKPEKIPCVGPKKRPLHKDFSTLSDRENRENSSLCRGPRRPNNRSKFFVFRCFFGP